MVYHNHIVNEMAPVYDNPTFRQLYGFKDIEAHDPPFRCNRYFKQVSYDLAKGILNYRHSEPFALLKNMKDIPRETHQKPIVYSKLFLKGALLGTYFGGVYFACGPVGALETEKVMAAAGGRAFSGRLFR